MATINLAWGGHKNGRIPRNALAACRYAAGHHLRVDAAASLDALATFALASSVPKPLLTDSYRTYDEQVRIRAQKGKQVATAAPGTSRHGWGLAVDAKPSFYKWMARNAGMARNYGWVNPEWAKRKGKSFEPWHWEYVGRAGKTLILPGPAPRIAEEPKLQIEPGDMGHYVSAVQRMTNGALARSGWDKGMLPITGKWDDQCGAYWNHARMRAQNARGVEYPDGPFFPNIVTITMVYNFMDGFKK